MRLREIINLARGFRFLLSLDDCQNLTEFANVYGRAVRQRSVHQETTMSKAGTLPSACYETNLPEDSSGESQDEDENIEFDTDESVENDGVEDDTRTNSYDEPQLSPEALFLIGRRSRFGRIIRFNGRFVQ